MLPIYEDEIQNEVRRGKPQSRWGVVGDFLNRANEAVAGRPVPTESMNDMINNEVKHRVRAAIILQDHEKNQASDEMTVNSLLGEFAKTGVPLYQNLAKEYMTMMRAGRRTAAVGSRLPEEKRLTDYLYGLGITDPHAMTEEQVKGLKEDRVYQYLSSQLENALTGKYGSALRGMRDVTQYAVGAEGGMPSWLKDDESSVTIGQATDASKKMKNYSGESLFDLGMGAVAGPAGAVSGKKSQGYDQATETRIQNNMSRYGKSRSQVISQMRSKGLLK
jgi:hypothetical protein